MQFSKIIIWGHKLHSHTHSYIHFGYYKAFKYLGFDTYWFDNKDDVKNFDFTNSLFFTEDQVHQNIPLNTTSTYILHNCNTKKYDDAGCTYINLRNYVHDCRLGKSFNYEGGVVEKLTYYAYYDKKNKALYQPWATDLLPDECAKDIAFLDYSKDTVYYIGSIWDENKSFIKDFKRACKDNNKKFIHKEKISDTQARELVVKSYIAPDIRGLFHKEVGYMPCRIFKNISYGIIPATNSVFIRDFFGKNTLPYAEKTYDLFSVNENYLQNQSNISNSLWLLNEVREHHTYVKRVETILSLL